jgi:hypothetical protein
MIKPLILNSFKRAALFPMVAYAPIGHINTPLIIRRLKDRFNQNLVRDAISNLADASNVR